MPAARADIDPYNVDVLGNTTPSVTNIPGLPGYSGYTVSLRAKNPNYIVSAVDVGSNPIDYPQVSFNWGLFGPMHQRWIAGPELTLSTPNRNSDPLDSHFLFDYNVSIMLPMENNNVSLSPLADTAVSDYGVGDLMRAIVGAGGMNLREIPFVYLVIPDGQTVEFRGKAAANGPARGDPRVESILNFTIGQVPEPFGLLGGSGVLALLVRRRRAA